MPFGSKTTLVSSLVVHTQPNRYRIGPFRSSGTNPAYYLMVQTAAHTWNFYRSTTITGTYSQTNSTTFTSSHVRPLQNGTYVARAMAWGWDRNIAGTNGAVGGFISLTGETFLGSMSAPQLSVQHAYSVANSQSPFMGPVTLATRAHENVGRTNPQVSVRYAVDRDSGHLYFVGPGPDQSVMGTAYSRAHWYRYLPSSPPNASITPGLEGNYLGKGAWAGQTRVYADAGTNSTSIVKALDNDILSSSTETTNSGFLLEDGNSMSFDGYTFLSNSEQFSSGQITRRQEGDPPGAPTSIQVWSSDVGQLMLEVFDGKLWAFVHRPSAQTIEYATISTGTGTFTTPVVMATSVSTCRSLSPLVVDKDGDGTPETLWVVYGDSSNTVYHEWSAGPVLAIQSATHAHTAGSPAITQKHILATQGATHGHTAGSPAITQKHILGVQGATHAHTADNATLTIKHTLAIDGATHGHIAENVALDTAGPSLQFFRPDGDISTGGWNTAPLYEKIDEAAPANDADFVFSSTDPSNDAFEVSLTDHPDPVVHTDHNLRIRHQMVSSGGGSPATIDLTFALYQGASQVGGATMTVNVDSYDNWITTVLNISETDAALITDYNDLRVRVTANKVSGARPSHIELSWMVFRTPLSAGTGPVMQLAGFGR